MVIRHWFLRLRETDNALQLPVFFCSNPYRLVEPYCPFEQPEPFVRAWTVLSGKITSDRAVKIGVRQKVILLENFDQKTSCWILLVFLPALSGISGNSEQKSYRPPNSLIQYTVLETQFRSLKHTTVIRIRENLETFQSYPSDNKARTVRWCKRPTLNSFQTHQTVLLYCWEMFK